MENQHRLIKGYEELDQERIDLMNEISAKGKELEALVEKVAAYVKSQRSAVAAQHDAVRGMAEPTEERCQLGIAAVTESKRLDYAQPERWCAMGRTELQTGLMFLKRGVAQPALF